MDYQGSPITRHLQPVHDLLCHLQLSPNVANAMVAPAI
jgi:hypothetical protein